MSIDIYYRPLTRLELDTVLSWAAAEGWNPGPGDADAFWAADPEAFWGIERDGELLGSGAITAYKDRLGFMGLFIVRPEFRGQGLGRDFWYFRRDKLRSRLRPEAPIAMDGVFAMQPFYAKGGFVFTHRNLRMEGVGRAGNPAVRVVELSTLPFAKVLAADEAIFGVARPEFLERWIRPTGGRALGVLKGDRLVGYGVLRPALRGFKIGPLFAVDSSVAEDLFVALSDGANGQPHFLDLPENNPAALALAARHGMKEVFGCARMVLGPVPETPWNQIFGVTTFELG